MYFVHKLGLTVHRRRAVVHSLIPNVVDSVIHRRASPATRKEEELPMRCPYCRHPDSRVVDSREDDDGQVIRRRRSCPECGRRFTTVEEATLAVIKRSGVTEPFSRQKVVNGVRRACQGRPVDEDQLAHAGPAGRGGDPGDRRRRGAQRRGRAGHPRPAARARRGRLPALRLASTRRSARSTTSRRRSSTCAPSTASVPTSPMPMQRTDAVSPRPDDDQLDHPPRPLNRWKGPAA